MTITESTATFTESDTAEALFKEARRRRRRRRLFAVGSTVLLCAGVILWWNIIGGNTTPPRTSVVTGSPSSPSTGGPLSVREIDHWTLSIYASPTGEVLMPINASYDLTDPQGQQDIWLGRIRVRSAFRCCSRTRRRRWQRTRAMECGLLPDHFVQHHVGQSRGRESRCGVGASADGEQSPLLGFGSSGINKESIGGGTQPCWTSRLCNSVLLSASTQRSGPFRRTNRSDWLFESVVSAGPLEDRSLLAVEHLGVLRRTLIGVSLAVRQNNQKLVGRWVERLHLAIDRATSQLCKPALVASKCHESNALMDGFRISDCPYPSDGCG